MNSKIATMNIDKQLLRLFERDIVDSPELINNESFVGTYAQLKAQDMGVPIETLVDSDAFSELAQAIVDHNSNGEAGNSVTSDSESKGLEETEKKAESLELQNRQELADRLNLPSNCSLVITAHDELSFDVVCRDTGKAFCTFVPLPWPKPDLDTLVINSETTWHIPNGRDAIVAYGKMLFAGDEAIDFDLLGFVQSCPPHGVCDDGEFRAEKGLAWLDDIPAIRGWCDIDQRIVALPSSSVRQPTYNECRKIITRVFKKLRRKGNGGFWAKQNFSCCNNCGWHRLRHGGPNGTPLIGMNGQPMFNEAGEITQPCVWYHSQDNDMLKEEATVYLAWGGADEHGQTIRRLFEEEGVTVDWDGTKTMRIGLHFGDSKKDVELP